MSLLRLHTLCCLATIFVGLTGCDSNSEESEKQAAVQGITIGFFPDEENFGLVRYTQSSVRHAITLQNLSKKSFFISTISLSDESDFKIEGHNCPGTTSLFLPGSGCEIDIVFKPTTAGDRVAKITAKFGLTIGDGSQEVSGDLYGIGGSSLVFPGIDSISDIGGNEMTINWTHVVGATKYLIYSINGETETEVARVDAPTTSYKVTGLALNTEYTWRARLVDSYDFVDDNKRDRAASTLSAKAPIIAAIAPAAGALAGGTTVTVTGQYFQADLSLKVGEVACTSSAYVSPTSATCVTPAAAVGAYTVSLTNPDGQKASFNHYSYQYAPTVTSISPVFGTWQGGTSVTITGANFLSGANVTIGGLPCQNVVWNASTSLTCVTTAQPQAVGGLPSDVVVTNSDNQSGTLPKAFNYQFTESSLIAGAQYPFGCQGGSPAETRFRTPTGLYFDGSDLLVTGYDDYAIWRVNLSNGNVSRFSGQPCIVGDTDGAAADASMTGTFAITKLGSDYYFTQHGNHVIRKIDGTTGAISTVAGALATAGTTDAASGADARFAGPRGMTTDGTYLYIADMTNHRIRRFNPTTGAVTTLAGSTAGFNDATGVAAQFNNPRELVYVDGNLYVADASNHRIRKVNVSTGVVTTFSGSGTAGHIDGAAGTARFNTPSSIATDGTDLFIAETVHLLRRVSLEDGSVSVLAGLYNTPEILDSPIATSARFRTITGIETDGTYVYVADASQNIRRVHISSGEVTTFIGHYQTPWYGTYLDGANARFSTPYGMVVNGTDAYIADSGFHRIRHLDLTTGVTTTIAGSGAAGGADGMGTAATFNSPRDITYCNNMLYVAEYSGQIIRSVNPANGTTTTIAGTYNTASFVNGVGSAARFNGPIGVVANANCTYLYIADYANHRIRRLNLSNNSVDTVAGSGVNGSVDGIGTVATLASPYRLAIIGSQMYLTSGGDHKLRRIDLSNFQVVSLNAGTAGMLNATDVSTARFYSPRAMATDGTRLYIADYTNHAARIYDPTSGAVTTITGNQAPASHAHHSQYPYGEKFGEIVQETQLAFPFGAGYSATEGLLLTTPYGVVRLK